MKQTVRRKYVRPTSKGQVTLPVSVRRALKIEPDTLLDVRVEAGRVILTPLRSYTDREIAGFLRDDALSKEDAAFFENLLSR